jgi:hypothetical protein
MRPVLSRQASVGAAKTGVNVPAGHVGAGCASGMGVLKQVEEHDQQQGDDGPENKVANAPVHGFTL